MSKNIRSGKPLILKIEGKRITAEKFLKATNSFLGLVRNVADEITGEKGAVTWLVTAEKGSQILTATPEASESVVKDIQSIPRAINQGFRDLEKKDKRPKGFSDTTLRHAKDLSSVIGNSDGDVNSIVLKLGKQSRSISENTSSHVNAILGSRRSEEGSVEGRVTVLSDKAGLVIYVDDVLTNHSVRCTPRNVEEQELIMAFRSRVIAIGTVHYRKDGAPVKIDVDRLRVLGKQGDLPGFEDVIGIFRRGD
ncbi:MAG: hypothetical protein JRJ45_09920 [Deltaproteobacteria bacterium]|nr:hypothetical protein [Deltaproteobacteria bacterium]